MKLIKRFTSNYDRTSDSNLSKLMAVFDTELDELKRCLLKIEEYREIDKATGQTLDNIGKNVLMPRGAMDDIIYRLYLKTKIKANLSGGQIRTLNEILDVLLEDHFLGLREVWNNQSYDYEPAAIEIRYRNFYEKIMADYIKLLQPPSIYEEIETEDLSWYLNGGYRLDGERLLDGGEIIINYPSKKDGYWWLNGAYMLDGERFLDGGYVFSYQEIEPLIIEAMAQTKKIVNFIKAGGVRAWWCEPVDVLTLINLVNNVKIKLMLLVENGIEINHDVKTQHQQLVENYPAFFLDGSAMLEGSLFLDGIRPIINHWVEEAEKYSEKYPVQTDLGIEHDSRIVIDQFVEHQPVFILDGTSFLNGVLALDGVRSIITHGVEVREVTA